MPLFYKKKIPEEEKVKKVVGKLLTNIINYIKGNDKSEVEGRIVTVKRLKTQGIFRIEASKKRINGFLDKVYKLIDDNVLRDDDVVESKGVDLEKDHLSEVKGLFDTLNLHDHCVLIKRYLGTLKLFENLDKLNEFNNDEKYKIKNNNEFSYRYIVDNNKILDKFDMNESMKIAKQIFELLAKVVINEKYNKMTIDNIAVVVSPNLYIETDPTKMHKQINGFKFLLMTYMEGEKHPDITEEEDEETTLEKKKRLATTRDMRRPQILSFDRRKTKAFKMRPLSTEGKEEEISPLSTSSEGNEEEISPLSTSSEENEEIFVVGGRKTKSHKKRKTQPKKHTAKKHKTLPKKHTVKKRKTQPKKHTVKKGKTQPKKQSHKKH